MTHRLLRFGTAHNNRNKPQFAHSLRTLSPDKPHTTAPPTEPPSPLRCYACETTQEVPMKGIIAWLLGVPLIVIILLYVFNFF